MLCFKSSKPVDSAVGWLMATDCSRPGLHPGNDSSRVHAACYRPAVQQWLQRKSGLFYPSTPLPAAPRGDSEMSHPRNGLQHPWLALVAWQVGRSRRHGRREDALLQVLISANSCRITFYIWQNAFFLTKSNTILTSSSVSTRQFSMDCSDLLLCMFMFLSGHKHNPDFSVKKVDGIFTFEPVLYLNWISRSPSQCLIS